jgi:GNAT superfamily N-acetyltransferase
MEPAVGVRVTVTFLRMDRKPVEPARAFPSGVSVVRLAACSVPFYRFLYDTVGADYLWWLRRTMPDPELANLLRDPRLSISVMYAGGEPAGFYELDARPRPDVNLSYFGLMPHAVGKGVGSAFLRSAIEAAWNQGASGISVNTCTADHPRALPAYLRAGFRPVRQAREVWNIPVRLGLRIPGSLRA